MAFLNELLPEKHQIEYNPFDFHGVNKDKSKDAIALLDAFAKRVTGFFIVLRSFLLGAPVL